jgi:ribosome-binding protein aMBF1 (putative translation factor)
MDSHLTTESCGSQQLIVGKRPNNLQPMVVLTKQAVRDDFAGRLDQAVSDHPLAPKDRGKAAWLARQLSVSGEMARKWLGGEALPNQARLAGIAQMLGVRIAWLRDGEAPARADGKTEPKTASGVAERSVTAYGVTVSEAGMLFAAEWEKLAPEARLAVEQLVIVMVGGKVRSSRSKPRAEDRASN